MARTDAARVVEMWTALMGNGRQADPRWVLARDAGTIMERWAPDTWLRTHPFVHTWVAETDRGLVGFVDGEVTHPSAVLAHTPSAMISDLWVEPDWRRQGLGQRLVRAFLKGARQAGYPEAVVGTLAADTRAVAFWTALGFGPWQVTLYRPAVPSRLTMTSSRGAPMNPLKKLGEQGQSPWLDYIDRDLLDSGKLARMIDDDGLEGVTSNPSIFAKAIGSSEAYDEMLQSFLADHSEATDAEAYEHLAIHEIRRACDIMRPVYDHSGRDDGFVSLEVSPDLADETDATIAEAERLWSSVDRPNVMIKVPGTPAGVPAIEHLIGEGINVNVTLLFGVSQYDAIARAYLRGLQHLADRDPAKLAEVDSVASLFVSRMDSMVDPELERIGSPDALALRGSVAIANAKMVYQRYRDLFHGDAFAPMRRRGARVQRVLWASTSTKNPDYSDVLYVEELVGPETVDTMPPKTIDAFRDHGRVSEQVTRGLADAAGHLADLARLGIDLHDVTEALQREGVTKFAEAFQGLLSSLSSKRAALAAK